jgi:hypothetical protein
MGRTGSRRRRWHAILTSRLKFASSWREPDRDVVLRGPTRRGPQSGTIGPITRRRSLEGRDAGHGRNAILNESYVLAWGHSGDADGQRISDGSGVDHDSRCHLVQAPAAPERSLVWRYLARAAWGPFVRRLNHAECPHGRSFCPISRAGRACGAISHSDLLVTALARC